MQLFRFQKGYSPVLLCNSHSGSVVLPEIAALMTKQALEKRDSNRHFTRLLDIPAIESAAMVTANLSRYVVDLDQTTVAKEGAGQLVPTVTGSGDRIYQPGGEPDAREIAKRIEHYYLPFHRQVVDELQRLVVRFGNAVALDFHAQDVDSAESSGPNVPDVLVEIDPQANTAWSDKVQALMKTTDWSFEVVANLNDGGSAIAKTVNRVAGVDLVRLCFNPVCYLDPDDGGLDFELARAFGEQLERLLVGVMKWAESRAAANQN